MRVRIKDLADPDHARSVFPLDSLSFGALQIVCASVA
jgi:hypothetical protein